MRVDKPRGAVLAAPCAALLCLAAPAWAQDGIRALTIQPRVSVSNTVTDNRELSEGNKQADNILEVSPGVRLVSRSPALQGSLDYALTSALYARESDKNELRHTLSANFLAKPADERFQLAAGASVSRQTISAFGTPSNGTNLDNDNTTDVASFSVTPSFRGRIGSAVSYEGSVGYSATKAASVDSSDSSALTGRFQVSGNAGRFGLAINATRDVSDFDEGRRTTDDRLVASLSTRIDTDLTATLRAGGERNTVTSAEAETNVTYGVGLVWTPTERTLFSVDRDKRYFGNGHSLVFQHRTARGTIRYVDARDATSSTGFLGMSNYELLMTQYTSVQPDPVLRDLLVREVLRRNGLSPTGQSGLGFLTAAVSLQRRQELSMVFVGRRSSATLSAVRTATSRLDRISGAPDDLGFGGTLRQTGFTMTLSHRLTPLTSLSFTGAQYKTDSDESPLGNDTRTYNLMLAGQFGLRTFYSLTLRRSEADGLNRYTESAAVGTINWQF